MKQGQDINQLYASGKSEQVTALMTKIMGLLDKVEVAQLQHLPEVSNLELSFLSSGGFPKEIFRQITASIQFSYGLYIRVMTDQIGEDYNEENIFQHDKWSFEKKQASIRFHDTSRDVTATTGAYIVPFSYENEEGKTRFAWMVTGFYDGVYRDGQSINAAASAGFLDALTPPEEDELRHEDYIIQSLIANGLQRIELGLYKIRLNESSSSLYIRNIKPGMKNSEVAEIGTTLDQYLLNCSYFSQSAREILVDIFGRDREDAFAYQETYLLIGQYLGNQWEVHENFDHLAQPISPQQPENVLPPKERIQKMLLNYDTTKLELEEYLPTGEGHIATVYTSMVEYSHEGTDDYENLEDEVLENLADAVESQIRANKTAVISVLISNTKSQINDLLVQDLEEIRTHLRASGSIKHIDLHEAYTAFYKDENGKAKASDFTSIRIDNADKLSISLEDGHTILEQHFTLTEIINIFSVLQEDHGIYYK